MIVTIFIHFGIVFISAFLGWLWGSKWYLGKKKVLKPILKLPVPVEIPTHKDNLQVIEGIGPKVEALLNSNGIWTFATMADKTPVELKHILADGGTQFTAFNPKTWPRQARYARDHRWQLLKQYQQDLKAGTRS